MAFFFWWVESPFGVIVVRSRFLLCPLRKGNCKSPIVVMPEVSFGSFLKGGCFPSPLQGGQKRLRTLYSSKRGIFNSPLPSSPTLPSAHTAHTPSHLFSLSVWVMVCCRALAFVFPVQNTVSICFAWQLNLYKKQGRLHNQFSCLFISCSLCILLPQPCPTLYPIPVGDYTDILIQLKV